MVNGKRSAAVELLMSYPDSMVAEILGVRLQTLSKWMQEPDFVEALRLREREQSKSLFRVARQAALRSAAALCQAAGNGTQPDPKVLLEVLKASKAFEPEEADPAEALRDIIRLAEQAAEAEHEPQAQ
jgi:hypothetical protein